MKNQKSGIERKDSTAETRERVEMTDGLLAYVLEAGGKIVIKGSTLIIEGKGIKVKGGWAEVVEEG